MRITLKRNLTRLLVVVFEGALFLAFVLWASKTYTAYSLGQTPTLRNLVQAVRLDPSNADYHLRLGMFVSIQRSRPGSCPGDRVLPQGNST